MNRKSPNIVGLILALAGPALLTSPLGTILGAPEGLTTKLLEQLSLWMLFALVIGIVMPWERQPLSSIGLRFQWQSVAWGLLLAAVPGDPEPRAQSAVPPAPVFPLLTFSLPELTGDRGR